MSTKKNKTDETAVTVETEFIEKDDSPAGASGGNGAAGHNGESGEGKAKGKGKAKEGLEKPSSKYDHSKRGHKRIVYHCKKCFIRLAQYTLCYFIYLYVAWEFGIEIGTAVRVASIAFVASWLIIVAIKLVAHGCSRLCKRIIAKEAEKKRVKGQAEVEGGETEEEKPLAAKPHASIVKRGKDSQV